MIYLALETIVVLGAIGAALYYRRLAIYQRNRADFHYEQYVDVVKRLDPGYQERVI